MKRFSVPPALPFLLILLFTVAALLSAEPVTLRYAGTTGYYLVERSNWSTYTNGSYSGLTHRETRASIDCTGNTGQGTAFSGFFYILQETLKDLSKTARSVDGIREASFTLNEKGEIFFSRDNGFPQLRGFPVYPALPVVPGDRWQAQGTRIVDPRNDGKLTALPILVEYLFIGEEPYRDRTVWRIRAKYATRYGKSRQAAVSDPDLKEASGTHDIDILVDVSDGAAVMMLDRLDETFTYRDGSSLRFKGNTAWFTQTPVPILSETLIAGLTEINAGAERDRQPALDGREHMDAPRPDAVPVPDGIPEATERSAGSDLPAPAEKPFTIEETPQGVRLSVRDIRFLADSEKILPEETWRLDAIADALRLVPEGQFLVEGHTAAVGKTAGEKELSVKRAKTVVDEMVKRGLLPEQFMYTGHGGTRPVADNGTPGGRAVNRRVEITILGR